LKRELDDSIRIRTGQNETCPEKAGLLSLIL
jgi:hypothetical protein